MTIREYIETKIGGFGLTEAHLADISAKLNLDDEFNPSNATLVGTCMCEVLEEVVLSPKQTSVSESGFSQSWDYSNLGKLYLYLCKKYGRTPDSNVVSMLGISVIVDRTGKW